MLMSQSIISSIALIAFSRCWTLAALQDTAAIERSVTVWSSKHARLHTLFAPFEELLQGATYWTTYFFK